jgi:hypothetical protein
VKQLGELANGFSGNVSNARDINQRSSRGGRKKRKKKRRRRKEKMRRRKR